MQERPILFNDEMVRAILDGRKTQTRRPVKPQPDLLFRGFDTGHWACDYSEKRPAGVWDYWGRFPSGYFNSVYGPIKCPFGKIGDKLWVREAFCVFDDDWRAVDRPHDLNDGPYNNFVYRAISERYAKEFRVKYRPSIHMPRWASRITLEIIGVRVERVQNITEKDARSGGIEKLDPRQSAATTINRFQRSWNSIYEKKGFGWDTNCWVWIIEFKRA